MKVYLKMPGTLKPCYNETLHVYKKKMAKGELQEAWRHLERAHILGQPYPFQHSEVHWLMLKFGFKISDWREIRGQVLRLMFGGLKSLVGSVPTGNTGGADVDPLLPMEIPEDLQQIINVNTKIGAN